MKPLALLLSIVVASAPSPAWAYLKFGTRVGTSVVDVRWHQSIAYFVTDRDVPGVTAGQFRAALDRAFATWQRAHDGVVRSEFQGVTSAVPANGDRRTTIGFADRPELDRVLGATSVLLDETTGQILEADVFFNTRFDWSVAEAGQPGRVDLESIALHELGHLLGLGHSALGETEVGTGGRRVIATGAVMFPIAMASGTIAERTLHADDVAGITDLYGTAASRSATTSIFGRITLNGRALYGAHVVAVNLSSGALVGGFALGEQGNFVIAGLAPGLYVLRVEPLDDADVEGFFPGAVDLDFRVSYSPRVVVAQAGSASDSIEVEVRPK